jgi:hypothetical protein
LVGSVLNGGGTGSIKNSYNLGNVILSNHRGGGLIGIVNNPLSNKQTLNMNNCFNFGDIIITRNNNQVGSILGTFDSNCLSVVVEVNATKVYSKPDVASANNGTVPKFNQPIGWMSADIQDLVNNVILVNPTLKEDSKYTLNYSKSPAFATELGNAFKSTSGRTPKLTWEK